MKRNRRSGDIGPPPADSVDHHTARLVEAKWAARTVAAMTNTTWPMRTQAAMRWLGLELDEVSFKEKAVSGIGGVVSIVLLIEITTHLVGADHAPLIVASMGASAVLLFAVPHGQLSQPWPVVAGHVTCAAIGVASARLIDSPAVAAGCAVGISILAMHQFKFIHPPAGATALTAVIGGPTVTSMGYDFVWRPVLINAIVMVTVAVAFNAPFRWRRYPTALAHSHQHSAADPSHAAVVAALRRLDSFIDISEDDLLELCRLVQVHSPTLEGASDGIASRPD